MLDNIKPPSTDESETGAEGAARERSVASTSRTDDSGPPDSAASETAHATQAEPSIELDEVFGLLKNRRRRDVLRHLSETTEEMRLGELAEVIAARECGKSVAQINSQERKRVYVGLYQCHLPKLADVGVITYNKPRGTVERGPAFDQITHYLPSEEPSERDTDDRPFMESLSNIISTGRQLL